MADGIETETLLDRPDMHRDAPVSPRRSVPGPVRLGEELPVFCEKCGYVLHGLPPVRCEHCELLHFRCPECGHTQPINTLRPAVQRILGRLRGWCLALWVFFKINFFFWLLFAWGAMGVEWSYAWKRNEWVITQNLLTGPVQAPPAPTLVARELSFEYIFCFVLLAIPYGMMGRMLLLRWRRSYLVGAVLAALVVPAILCGTWLERIDRRLMPSPYTYDYLMILAITAGSVLLGAMTIWPIWAGLVRLFLPSQTATSFLAWQRSPSLRSHQLAQQ